MTPRPPRKARAVRVEDELWTAAQRKAEERGDVLSEEIRAFIDFYVTVPAIEEDPAADTRAFLKRYARSSGARSSVPRVGEPGSGRALGA